MLYSFQWMPAHFLREKGVAKGISFQHFSEAAQQIGVYTTTDYISILNSPIKEWEIETLRFLSDAGERARDYIMPCRHAYQDCLKECSLWSLHTSLAGSIPVDSK